MARARRRHLRDHGKLPARRIKHFNAGQRAAAAAFTDDDGQERDFQQRHLAKVDGDGFGNVPFLSANARESSGGID